MSLCSLANLRRELFSSDYTRYDPKHLTVEAIPVLSDEGSQDLVQPDGKKSWRRLDTVEGCILLVLLSYLQSDSPSETTAII